MPPVSGGQAVGNDFGWGAAIGGAITAIVAGIFAWIVQRGKSGTDERVAVLAEWEKLTGSLSARLSAVESNFADYRTKVAKDFEDLRKKHSAEIDEMRKKHRDEMRTMRELNEGLQRMIAQNSKSTAQLMGESPVTGGGDED